MEGIVFIFMQPETGAVFLSYFRKSYNLWIPGTVWQFVFFRFFYVPSAVCYYYERRSKGNFLLWDALGAANFVLRSGLLGDGLPQCENERGHDRKRRIPNLAKSFGLPLVCGFSAALIVDFGNCSGNLGKSMGIVSFYKKVKKF